MCDGLFDCVFCEECSEFLDFWYFGYVVILVLRFDVVM